MTYQFSKYF